MLNSKRVLCLGNNTRETDKIVSELAKQNNSKNMGLLTTSEVDITNGFYHTSFHDFGDTTLIMELVAKFNYVIFLDQGVESYDNETAYHLTKHIVNLARDRLEIEIDIIDAKKA